MKVIHERTEKSGSCLYHVLEAVVITFIFFIVGTEQIFLLVSALVIAQTLYVPAVPTYMCTRLYFVCAYG